MLCVRAVSKAMSTQEPLTYEGRRGSRSLGRGSIVNMGSASSYVGAPGTMSYTTSKHAIIGLTKTAGKQVHSVFAEFWSRPVAISLEFLLIFMQLRTTKSTTSA